MGKWADLAREIEIQEPRANSANSANSSPNGTNDTIGTARLLVIPSEERARALLADWHRNLARLDVYEVPDGFDQNRWGQLVLDAWWLYEEWASRLVRDGWSAMDLFGVIPAQPGWGGLADRLQGSRSLLIDDTGKAYWRRNGVSFELNRGVGDALRGGKARLVWEPGHPYPHS